MPLLLVPKFWMVLLWSRCSILELQTLFKTNVDTVFTPYIWSQLATADRVDIVWDVYIPYSLKNTTSQKRGKGVRRRVASTTVIPRNWKDFLDENKTELWELQAYWLKAKQSMPLMEVMSCALWLMLTWETAPLIPWRSRLLPPPIYMWQMLYWKFKIVYVHTVDADVVVLPIAMFNQIKPVELWVALIKLPFHEPASVIDPRICATSLFSMHSQSVTLSLFLRERQEDCMEFIANFSWGYWFIWRTSTK